MAMLQLVYPGPPEQKQPIKLTAMQKISDVLPDVCAKFRPALDPSSIQLSLNKKPVDIKCPFRLANIPAGSVLHITSSKPVSTAGNIAAPLATASTSTTTAPIAAPTRALASTPDASEVLKHAPVTSSAPTVVPTTAATSTRAVPTPIPSVSLPETEPSAQSPIIPSAAPQPAAQHAVVAITASTPLVAAAEAQHTIANAALPIPEPGLSPTAAKPAAPTAAAAAASQGASHDMQTQEPTPMTQQQQQPGTAAAEGLVSTSLQPPANDVEMTDASIENNGTAAALQDATASDVISIDLLHVSKLIGLNPPREAIVTTETVLRQLTAEAVKETDAMQGVTDNDDAFYELTPEDLAEISRAAEAKRKEESRGLKTQAIRDAEEAAKMQAFGPVALRLRFPDGLVVQAAFKAKEKIQDVKDFIAALLAVPTTQVTLMTTPPKQVYTDMSLTLYKAGWVPAAVVHCKLTGATGATLDLLKPQLRDCLVTQLHPHTQLPGQHADVTSSPAGALGRPAGQTGSAAPSSSVSSSVAMQHQAASRAPAGPSNASGQAKVPKWLKLK